MTRKPSFEIWTEDDVEMGDVLLIGLADVGTASLTAIDYLVSQLEMTQIGHVTARNLPVVAPVEDGMPRHPIRLYTIEESPLTVLVSEVFIPVPVAELFAETLVEWSGQRDLDEIGVLHGALIPHNEEEHRVFYAATPEFHRNHFNDETTSTVTPLPGGVLDGVNGELLTRGLEASRPSIGVFVTPVHLPGPDFDAALRLLEGVESCYPIDVDEAELRRQSAELQQYYEELAAHLTALRQGDQPLDERDFPEDRMYM